VAFPGNHTLSPSDKLASDLADVNGQVLSVALNSGIKNVWKAQDKTSTVFPKTQPNIQGDSRTNMYQFYN